MTLFVLCLIKNFDSLFLVLFVDLKEKFWWVDTCRVITDCTFSGWEQPALSSYLFGALFTNYQMSDGKLADQLFHHHDEPCYGMYCSNQSRTFLHRETYFMQSSITFPRMLSMLLVFYSPPERQFSILGLSVLQPKYRRYICFMKVLARCHEIMLYHFCTVT